MMNRREMLKATGLGLLSFAGGVAANRLLFAAPPGAPLPEGTIDSAVLDALPGKRPLIKRSWRPPNFETPLELLGEPFTPNDAFFVRYHLGDIPEIKAEGWRLKIGGDGADRPQDFTLDDLRRHFEPVEIAAVCQCSGNRRGFSQPHVAGVEWGFGAMGNARWKGVRLKEVLDKAGVKKEAIEVAFNGADKPVLDKTPDFVKSLPLWKAMDENTLIAFEMNGQPLPHWNGFPARIVAPGWTATYWVKHVTDISLLTQPFKGYWMDPAYRIPRGKFPVVDRFISQETATNTPITEMVVNSVITSLRDGEAVKRGQPLTVKGVAWDGGYGISRVDISTDEGKSWSQAELGPDSGRFSLRPWSFRLTPNQPGSLTIMARAANRLGQTQTAELIWNPAGYHNNVMHRIAVMVA